MTLRATHKIKRTYRAAPLPALRSAALFRTTMGTLPTEKAADPDLRLAVRLASFVAKDP